MNSPAFDRAIADRGLTAVREMSAAGVPILPPPPVLVRCCVQSAADVSVPGEGASSRPSPGTADDFLTQGSAAAEARAAHNREVAGSTPAPATNPVAKASEDNGRISAAMCAPMAGEVSRDSDAADRQRPSLSGFTGDDDGRDVEAAGGAASVITNSPSALTGAETAPAIPHRLPEPAGAVTLSDATMFILGLIAAHEGRPAGDIVADLVAAAGEAIGLSPLLTHAASEIGDLAGLPNYARRAANRFRSGVP